MTPTVRRVTFRLALVVLLGSLLSSACSSDGASSSETSASTDIAALGERYPLSGDLEVDSVVWQYHTNDESGLLDSIAPPTQDQNPLVEAVFRFTDESEFEALLAQGRAAEVARVPAWYPEALTALGDAEPIAVLVSRSVPGLPGIVYTFVDAPGYVVVIYDAALDS